MYFTQGQALYRNGLSAQTLKNRTHVALAISSRSRRLAIGNLID
ncbi:hypothetical protein [Coleofasciculus sp. G2-EDA-02]